jgi:hypothetical protein
MGAFLGHRFPLLVRDVDTLRAIITSSPGGRKRMPEDACAAARLVAQRTAGLC